MNRPFAVHNTQMIGSYDMSERYENEGKWLDPFKLCKLIVQHCINHAHVYRPFAVLSIQMIGSYDMSERCENEGKQLNPFKLYKLIVQHCIPLMVCALELFSC